MIHPPQQREKKEGRNIYAVISQGRGTAYLCNEETGDSQDPVRVSGRRERKGRTYHVTVQRGGETLSSLMGKRSDYGGATPSRKERGKKPFRRDEVAISGRDPEKLPSTLPKRDLRRRRSIV